MTGRSQTIVLSLSLLAAIAVGLFARFHALGQSSLAIDEYYLAQSIRNILETGFPQFDCGGFYTRGLIQQYLTAGLNILGLDMHVALRMITVFANIAAIPAVYLLARNIGGVTAAVGASILFALSIWEIEMARFGRMYAPFQAVFVWYCIALCNAYRGSQRSFYLSIILGTATLFVYEGAALLLCTTFIPLIAGKVQSTKNWALAGSSFVFGVWFLTRDFDSAGQPKLPDNFEQAMPTWHLPIDEPLIPFGFALSNPFAVVALIAAVLLTIFVAATAFKSLSATVSDRRAVISYLWLGLTIWLAASGFFGIILMISLPLLVWRWLDFSRITRNARAVVFSWLIVSLAAWIIHLFQVTEGTVIERGTTLVYSLILYPDVYSEVVYRWLRSLPVVTIVALLSIGTCFLLTRKRPEDPPRTELFLFLVGLLLVLFFLVAILPQPYASIRYTYFLHPLVIVLVVASWTTIAARLTGKEPLQTALVLGAVAMLMLVSVDYRLGHIWNIGTPEVTYRTAMSKWATDRVYRRWDYRSPAEYVNAHAIPSEEIVTTSHSVPYYLRRLTYFYASAAGQEFPAIASCRGTKERWSYADLLSSPEALRKLHEIGDQHGLWAIIRSPDQPEASTIEQEIAGEYSNNVVYSSIDKRLVVVHIPAVKPQSDAPR